MKNVVVFGGTGMLAETTKWLIDNAEQVSVSGRNIEKMIQLDPDDKNSNTRFVKLDYSDSDILREYLSQTIRLTGPIDLVVSWIHSGANDAVSVVLEEIHQRQSSEWRFIHIKGSSHDLSAIQREITMPENSLYREVQLGFKNERGVSRWLTNEEISSGVISAIKNDERKTVIGVVHPWEQRP